jgi:hypothetical protein
MAGGGEQYQFISRTSCDRFASLTLQQPMYELADGIAGLCSESNIF